MTMWWFESFLTELYGERDVIEVEDYLCSCCEQMLPSFMFLGGIRGRICSQCYALGSHRYVHRAIAHAYRAVCGGSATLMSSYYDDFTDLTFVCDYCGYEGTPLMFVPGSVQPICNDCALVDAGARKYLGMDDE